MEEKEVRFNYTIIEEENDSIVDVLKCLKEVNINVLRTLILCSPSEEKKNLYREVIKYISRDDNHFIRNEVVKQKIEQNIKELHNHPFDVKAANRLARLQAILQFMRDNNN